MHGHSTRAHTRQDTHELVLRVAERARASSSKGLLCEEKGCRGKARARRGRGRARSREREFVRSLSTSLCCRLAFARRRAARLGRCAQGRRARQGCTLAGEASRIRETSGSERPRAAMSSPASLPKEIQLRGSRLGAVRACIRRSGRSLALGICLWRVLHAYIGSYGPRGPAEACVISARSRSEVMTPDRDRAEVKFSNTGCWP